MYVILHQRRHWDEMDEDDESVGEPLLCHGRQGRKCGYLEYKRDWRVNHVPYSSWRSEHPRGSLGGNSYDEDDESVGLGFAGSRFRHAVNNQRPKTLETFQLVNQAPHRRGWSWLKLFPILINLIYA